MGDNRYFPEGYHTHSDAMTQGRHYPGSAHPHASHFTRPEPVLRAAAHPEWQDMAPAQPYAPAHPYSASQHYHNAQGYAPHAHAAPQFVAPAAPVRAQVETGTAPAQPTSPPLHPQALMQGLGAVLSLALVVGAGLWSWQMMHRDVSGVPVVRALEGPTRVVPADAGGRQVAYQGLSVNNLAAANVSDEGRDTIILAPPAVDLSARDLAQPALQTGVTPQPVEVALNQDLPMDAQDDAMDMPQGQALVRSPRPQPRAAGIGQRVASLSNAPAAAGTASDFNVDALAASITAGIAGGVREIDPATIGPGTRLVQLGAFDDAQTARDAWDQLSRRFSPLLDDRGRVIEAAHSGGSVFFRLRAHGFTDERDARRFCAALIAQSLDCIPVLIR
jgi:hypothetical protein